MRERKKEKYNDEDTERRTDINYKNLGWTNDQKETKVVDKTQCHRQGKRDEIKNSFKRIIFFLVEYLDLNNFYSQF